MNRAQTDKHSRWKRKRRRERGTFDRARYWHPQDKSAWAELGRTVLKCFEREAAREREKGEPARAAP